MFKKKLIETLKNTINNLEEGLSKGKKEREVLENKIKELEQENLYINHNNLLLIRNILENNQKMKDLENNIEFLYNNLGPAKRKIAPRN